MLTRNQPGYHKEYYQLNKEKRKRQQQLYALRTKFGLTEEAYDTLLRNQNGSCAVCGRPRENFSRQFAVDHDHATGEIRGLLCLNCNRVVIGRYRQGNGGLDLLRNAVKYLEGPYTGFIIPPQKKRKRTRGKRNKS